MYGIDLADGEVDTIASVRFFKLATRLPVYQGAVAAKAEEEQEAAKKKVPKHLRDQEVQLVPDSALSMLGDDIEFK